MNLYEKKEADKKKTEQKVSELRHPSAFVSGFIMQFGALEVWEKGEPSVLMTDGNSRETEGTNDKKLNPIESFFVHTIKCSKVSTK